MRIQFVFKFLCDLCALSGRATGSSSAEPKFRDQWKMVRRHQRHAAAVEHKLFQRQLAIKVHMIEMHDGQHAGIGALAVEMELDIDALKGMLQSLRYQAARPFVEVADDQTRVLQLRR